jgi:hypothetical protein
MYYPGEAHYQWIVKMRGLLFGLFLLGCQEQTLTTTKVQIQPSTPQSKLEWVARRLQHVFEMGTPSRLAGIRVEHILSYQLNEPSEPSADYHATVLIQTKTENMIQSASLSTPVEREGASGQGASGQGVSRHGAGGQATSTVGQNFHGGKRTIGGDPHIIQEKQSFELVYRNEQWQLVAELDTNPERLWFQYALQQ